MVSNPKVKKQLIILVQADTEAKLWEGLKQLASEKHQPQNCIGTCGELADVAFDYYIEDSNAYPALATHYDEIRKEWS
jgi:hypothetical protein